MSVVALSLICQLTVTHLRNHSLLHVLQTTLPYESKIGEVLVEQGRKGDFKVLSDTGSFTLNSTANGTLCGRCRSPRPLCRTIWKGMR